MGLMSSEGHIVNTLVSPSGLVHVFDPVGNIHEHDLKG